jgi:hypothetical protein
VVTVSVAVLVLLAAGGYALYRSFFQQVVQPFTSPPTCLIGTGLWTVPLQPDQAAIAATIAGVAVRKDLPRAALTIAFATALQESDMENLDYGDRDSLGVFQQRPSQGWGSPAEIENPIYSATKFFDALVQVPRYTKLPVWQAAQAVQRSADGPAYQQYAQVGAIMSAAFMGARPHAVTCWYTPAAGRADYAAAARGLAATFGTTAGGGVVRSATTVRSGQSEVFEVRASKPWTVASWLVTHGADYGITRVRYDGYQWTASDSATAWSKDPGPASGGLVAS